jgi:hypothetical protein
MPQADANFSSGRMAPGNIQGDAAQLPPMFGGSFVQAPGKFAVATTNALV